MTSVTLSGEDIIDSVDAELPAALRLERSRERLRLAMRRGAGLDRPPAAPGSLSAWTHGLLDKLRALPGADVVLDVLRRWWANHPLHTAAQVASDAAGNLAAPMARRNPLALMVGALLTGALMARLRPWRWLPRTLMFAGLLPQLASRLVASVPLETWIAALGRHDPGPANRFSRAREISKHPAR